MILGFNCPHCGMVTRVNAFKPGDTIQCQRCGRYLVIPENLSDINTLGESPISHTNPGTQYIPEVTITNPYLQFWSEPRATFRYVVANDRFMEALVFIVAASAIGSVNSFLFTPATTEENIFNGGGGAVLLFLFSLIAFFAGGFMYWLCGKMLGGKGEFSRIVTVLGWAQLPGLLLALAIPLGILHQYTTQDSSGSVSAAYGLYMLVAFCFGIYAIVLSVIAISEAHQLTIGQSIGTLVLAFCAIAVLFVVLLLIFVIFGLAIGGLGNTTS